jgi:hypothetical protein
LYPSEFSAQAKNRIEAEQIRAYQDFEEARRAVRGDFETEPLLCQCILRVFLAFAREACAFGKSSTHGWSIDKIDDKCREFLRRMTIRASFDKGLGGRMTSKYSGSIDDRTMRGFQASAEWRRYQDLLLEVAGDDRTVAAMASAAVPTKKPGPKRDIETARRVAGIVGRLAGDQEWRDQLDEICDTLDQEQVPRPTTWRKKNIRSWAGAAAGYPNLAKQAIAHRLKNALQS